MIEHSGVRLPVYQRCVPEDLLYEFKEGTRVPLEYFVQLLERSFQSYKKAVKITIDSEEEFGEGKIATVVYVSDGSRTLLHLDDDEMYDLVAFADCPEEVISELVRSVLKM